MPRFAPAATGRTENRAGQGDSRRERGAEKPGAKGLADRFDTRASETGAAGRGWGECEGGPRDRARAAVEVGDWLDLARGLAPASVDFVYADPPFNTGVLKRTPPGAWKRGGGAGRGSGSDPGVHAYADAWASMGAYVEWLRARVAATLASVRATGVVAIHCDQRASHRIRVMLDDLLGGANFVNHLIWSYGLGGSSARRFARKHDDIIVYSVTPGGHYFEAPLVPATSRRLAGRLKKSTDVLEVASINNMARERTGYPTQKPLALLEILVRAFCPVGGVVLDPCCGSGTTLAAAVGTGRRAIGFDVNEGAARVARRRLGLGDGPGGAGDGGRGGGSGAGGVPLD